jgi:hypothetical protein
MVQVIDGLADLARGTAVNTQVSGLPRTLNSPWRRPGRAGRPGLTPDPRRPGGVRTGTEPPWEHHWTRQHDRERPRPGRSLCDESFSTSSDPRRPTTLSDSPLFGLLNSLDHAPPRAMVRNGSVRVTYGRRPAAPGAWRHHSSIFPTSMAMRGRFAPLPVSPDGPRRSVDDADYHPCGGYGDRPWRGRWRATGDAGPPATTPHATVSEGQRREVHQASRTGLPDRLPSICR